MAIQARLIHIPALALCSMVITPALAQEAAATAEAASDEATAAVEVKQTKEAKEAPKDTSKEKATQAASDAAKDAEKKAEDKGDKKKDAPSEEELRKKMRELEQELRDARNDFDKKVVEDRKKADKAKKEALKNAVLPKNPTLEQTKAFMSKLRKATEGRRSYSSSDPVVKKLRGIPKEHYGLLLLEASSNTSLRYYASSAIRNVETESLRKDFVKNMTDHPAAITVIVSNGWSEDIRPLIKKRIASADGKTNPAWFQAAVELRDPSLYPKLHEIAISSRYAFNCVMMLKMLPDYDLGHTVRECWKRSRSGKLSLNNSSQFAPMAAEYGEIEALANMVSQLRYARNTYYSSHSYYNYNNQRTNVLRFIEFSGSNKEIISWFNKNKSKLVFDHMHKRFVLPKPMPGTNKDKPVDKPADKPESKDKPAAADKTEKAKPLPAREKAIDKTVE